MLLLTKLFFCSAWALKDEFKPAHATGVTLKICTCHYNDDLRKRPDKGVSSSYNKIHKQEQHAAANVPRRITRALTVTKVKVSVKQPQQQQFFASNSSASVDQHLLPTVLRKAESVPTPALSPASSASPPPQDKILLLQQGTLSSDDTNQLSHAHSSVGMLQEQQQQPQVEQKRTAKSRTETLNDFYKRQCTKLLQNPQIQALLCYQETSSIPKVICKLLLSLCLARNGICFINVQLVQ